MAKNPKSEIRQAFTLGVTVTVMTLALGHEVQSQEPEQYLCLADATTGAQFNSGSGNWEEASFDTDDNRYIVSPSDRDGVAYEVKRVGNPFPDFPDYRCASGFNNVGNLFCGGGSAGQFIMNTRNNRFVSTYLLGYWTVGGMLDLDGSPITDADSDTPILAFGQCSSF